MFSLSFLDGLLIVAYFAAMIGLGSFCFRGQTTIREYFLADRSMGWFVVALSIIATNLSAITMMGVPDFVFRGDLKNAAPFLIPVFPAVVILVVILLARMFYRMQIYTVYEYLERRYGLSVRVIASLIFMAAKCGWLATVMYVPSLALSVVSGLPLLPCILLTGLSTTVYAAAGGMKAVIWTDVAQFFVMIAGIVAALAIVLGDGPVAELWGRAQQAPLVPGLTATDHTVLFDFSFDLTTPFTFWGIIVAAVVATFFDYGLNQIVVQRYFAARSLKESVKGVVIQSFMVIPIMLALYVVGLGLVSYYLRRPELLQSLLALSPDNPSEALRKVFPHFVAHCFPVGLVGLTFAALYAATMSSVSSAINSLSTVCMVDYYKRFWPAASQTEARDLFLARCLTVFWGVAATGLALSVGGLGKYIVDILGMIYGFLVGPLVAIFLLAVLTRRANSAGAIGGTLIGFAVVAGVSFRTKVFWQWWGAIGVAVTFVSGYLLSLALGRRPTAAQLQAGSA